MATRAPRPAISSVLVANRGEVVVRICRTLAARGLRSIAVATPADRGAPYLGAADVAVEVASYLDADGLVGAAKAAGADAVHPGYGFLAEDPGFARAVLGAGMVWIGPPPEAIEAMGDKIRAKATVGAAGVPVVPGAGAPGMDDEELAEAARTLGLPVLVKPAAGGGGKGMRRVEAEDELTPALAAARREAEAAFGDGTLLIERWVPRPRHVEVQVFFDAHGGAVHLGERECSLQRRHQKLVEETPSPLLDEATRRAMTGSALDAARAVGYVGAGTVEFIVSSQRPDEYYFMEMNTRLQVEHPVTEEVTSLDLVDWQLRVAAGEALPCTQDEIRFSGHAVEARVYAEDPARGFLPTGGTVLAVEEPRGRPGVRVDSALAAGAEVGSRYDPMLAKVVAWAPSRDQAIARLRTALEATTVLGVTTNVAYLAKLLAHPDVAAGRLDTELVGRTLAELSAPDPGGETEAALAAACRVASDLEPPAAGPWEVADGWRLCGLGDWTLRLRAEARAEAPARLLSVHVAAGSRLVGPRPAAVRVEAGEGSGAGSPMSVWATRRGDSLELTVDGVRTCWASARRGDEVWVGRSGATWRFAVEREDRAAGAEDAGGGGRLTSPMPGVVVAVHASPGETVRAGQVLVVVEAMKMEHSVAAPRAGTVAAVFVRPGQTVALDEALAELDLPAGDGGHGGQP